MVSLRMQREFGTACHYRKLRPDARTPFDKVMLAEAGVLTDSLHITGLAGIEHETRLDGSLPQRKARPMDEKVCFGENSAPGGVEARAAERTKYDVAKDRLSSAPLVSMVQAAHLRNGHDATVLRSVYGSRVRGVFRQG